MLPMQVGGAVSGTLSTGGRWRRREMKHHINAKEMLAVEFGLKALFKQVSDMHIQIFSDSTTAVAFV